MQHRTDVDKTEEELERWTLELLAGAPFPLLYSTLKSLSVADAMLLRRQLNTVLFSEWAQILRGLDDGDFIAASEQASKAIERRRVCAIAEEASCKLDRGALWLLEGVVVKSLLTSAADDFYGSAVADPDREQRRALQTAAGFLRKAGADDLATEALRRASKLKAWSALQRPRGGRPETNSMVYGLFDEIAKRYPAIEDPVRHRLIAAIASPFVRGRHGKTLYAERVREILNSRKKRERNKPGRRGKARP